MSDLENTPADKFEPELSDSKLTRTGGGLSVAYLAVLGIYTFFFTDWDWHQKLDPNELGDFLAGAFAPLAFLWLVLGFLQQGRELRNSAKALHLQVGELQASVEQSRQMVQLTRDQLQLDREAQARSELEKRQKSQPILRNRSKGSSRTGGTYTFKFCLTNAGGECFDLEGCLVLEGLLDVKAFATVPHFTKGSEIDWYIELSGNYFERGRLLINYRDIAGMVHFVNFPIRADGPPDNFSVEVETKPIPNTDC